MNNEALNRHLQELCASGMRLLVVIVNRGDGEKASRVLREKHFYMQFTCMAQGTRGSEFLDLLGLSTTDKAMLLCLSPSAHVKEVLPELAAELQLKKAGKGIAFTVPISGVCLPEGLQDKLPVELEKNMEIEAEDMDSMTHSLILAVVDQGNSEEVVEAAKTAGAKGGTIINARRTGMEEAVKFFGISVHLEKEVVAILTTRQDKQAILDAINEPFGLQSPAHGIIMTVPVDGVSGMANGDVVSEEKG